MSKFYNYSFNNTLLIAMQKPEATLVAGYTAWQRNFDRHVMKGEKGIRILAPAPYKTQMEMEKIDPKTQKPVLDADGKPVTEMVEVMRPAFKVVSVFDVSQTEGKELPDIVVDELKGTVENYTAFFEALRQISPVPIDLRTFRWCKGILPSGRPAYCHSGGYERDPDRKDGHP
jgi:antirestriction protein ArdC